MRKPFVSFVIPTYNSAKTLALCLQSIAVQNYPKSKIEVILSDGGSSDETSKIAGKYHAKFIKVPNKRKQGAEYNRAYGALKSKGEILAFLDHDNVLPHENWLKSMLQPFSDYDEIVGCSTLRYYYDKKDNVLGRYFALFGVNDVVPYFLGKAERISYIYDSPEQYGVFKHAEIDDKGGYFLVNFQKGQVPTLGSNGFLFRKNLVFSHALIDLEHFYHIDIHVDMINKGFCKYALVKETLAHKTHERGILNYLKRRILFVQTYHLSKQSLSLQKTRRYSVVESKDFYKLAFFIFAALTFILTLYDSLRGYRKIID